jgi:hypothetical protein
MVDIGLFSHTDGASYMYERAKNPCPRCDGEPWSSTCGGALSKESESRKNIIAPLAQHTERNSQTRWRAKSGGVVACAGSSAKVPQNWSARWSAKGNCWMPPTQRMVE